MGGQGADDEERRSRKRFAGGCKALAGFLEVGAASVEFLYDGTSLAAKAARLVAIGLRVLAKWARR